MRLFLRFLCLFVAGAYFIGCSIPNLEDPACTDARNAVRKFYSFHFGNGLAFADEDLDRRKNYLMPKFFESLRYPPRDFPPGTDPFTWTDHDPPKAFRVGECTELSPERTRIQVLLFWRDDVRDEQREIFVESQKVNDQWLVDRISRANS